MGFSEAWLRDYQARRAGHVAPSGPPDRPQRVIEPVVASGAALRLRLRRPTITLNELIRLDWRERRTLAAQISSELARQLSVNWVQPLGRVTVTIVRYALNECDKDNLYGGAKLTIDCLLPYSKRHPHGLGLVRDDSPEHMEQRVLQRVVATQREQHTEIIIDPVT